MNTLKLSLLAAAATFSLGSLAQEKEKTEKKSRTIVITQDSSISEKMTIVVDGDKVTINGQPVEELKNVKIKVLDRGSIYMPEGLSASAKALVGRIAPGAGFYSFGSKPFLGVSIEDGEGGAKITEIIKESAAEKAGLKQGDVITKIDKYNIADADDVHAALAQLKPEQKVRIWYKRNGREQTAEAILGKNSLGSVAGDDFNFNFDESWQGKHPFFQPRPKLGLQVQDVEEGTGVKVLNVEEEAPAAKAGIQKDDVIVEFNGRELKGVDDIRKEAMQLKEGNTVKVKYKRGNSTQTAEIKFPKKLKKADI